MRGFLSDLLTPTPDPHSPNPDPDPDRRRDKNWITWKDANLTRLQAIRSYQAAKGKAKRDLLRDVVVISLLTIQPPDRVGGVALMAPRESPDRTCLTTHPSPLQCSDQASQAVLDPEATTGLGRRGSGRALVDRSAESNGWAS